MERGSFCYMLYRPDSQFDAFREALEELRDATPEQLEESRPGRRTRAEDLRAFWSALCRNWCLNGSISEYSLPFVGCARSSCNPCHLGAGLGAWAANEYKT